MRFLVDENLPRRLKSLLNGIGRFPVDHEFDHLPAGTPDADLKSLAAQLDLIVITRDREFIPSDVWSRTYLDNRVSALILTASLGSVGSTPVRLKDLERWFRDNWRRIEDVFDDAPRPLVVRAYLDGRLVADDQ